MAKRTKTLADPAGPILSPARTRVIYCGDNLQQLKKLPGGSVDLITMDPPFHSHRNDEVFSRRDPGEAGVPGPAPPRCGRSPTEPLG